MDPHPQAMSTEAPIQLQSPQDSTNSEETPALTEAQIVAENVKALKRKVISVSKLREIFFQKEQETATIRKELAEAQATIATLQRKSTSIVNANSDLQKMAQSLETKTRQAVRFEAEASKTKHDLKVAEEHASKLGQKLRNTEMLNTQLEQKVKDWESLRSELQNAKKELARGAARKNEITEMRGKIMKYEADLADRTIWLNEEKKRWEREHGVRAQEEMRECRSRADALEQQLEDNETEHLLEMSMKKGELTAALERLEENRQKMQELNRANRDLKGQVASLKAQIISRPTKESAESTPPPMTDNAGRLSQTQITDALGSLEELKAQFSILQWINGGDSTKNQVQILEAKIKELAQDKDNLQRALEEERRKDHFGSNIVYTPATSHTPSRTLLHHAPSGSTTNPIAVPVAEDTIARSDIKRRGRKRKTAETGMSDSEPLGRTPAPASNSTVLLQSEPLRATYSHREEEHFGDFSDDEISSTPIPIAAPSNPTSKVGPLVESEPKKRRKSKKDVPPKSSAVPKAKAVRAKAQPNPLADIPIRNASAIVPIANLYEPSEAEALEYFTKLFDHAISDDSRAVSKLTGAAAFCAKHMDTFFETIVKKTGDIVQKVAEWRQGHDISEDRTDNCELEDVGEIAISTSLSPAERQIVQFLSLLNAFDSEVQVLSQFYAFAYDTILKSALSESRLSDTSILTRILTGVCRTQDSMDWLRVFTYDILREVSLPKVSLVLVESIASIWPAVLVLESEHDPQDPQHLMLSAFQAILGTHQLAVSENEQLPFGYETFTQKCGWHEEAFVDELVPQMVGMISNEKFSSSCQSIAGYEFNFRKALELLMAQGCDWDELYTGYITKDLGRMIFKEEGYALVIPLVADVVYQGRYYTPSAGTNDVDSSKIRALLEALFNSEASLHHQATSAMAMVKLSDGDASRLQSTIAWFKGLSDRDRKQLPFELVATLQTLVA